MIFEVGRGSIFNFVATKIEYQNKKWDICTNGLL